MSIQIYGMFDSKMSLGDVSSGIAKSLVTLKADCRLSNILRPDAYWDALLQRVPSSNEFGVADAQLAPFAGLDKKSPIGIYVGPLPIPLSLLSSHQIKIAFLVCEQSHLPKNVVSQCNDLDLLCVPSSFCRRVFAAAGVNRPIRKVLHGLSEEFRSATMEAKTSSFQFFNTFACFAPPERKGFQDLLDCFCDVFSGDRATELVVRTHATPDACERISAASSRANARLEPLVYAPVDEYIARYATVDCVVHPSKSEGFGLIPFHALACGIPVIAPAHTGMLEYLDANNAALVKWTHTTVQPYHIEIDKESLRMQMLAARSDCVAWKQKAQVDAMAFREKFAWSNVLKSFLDFLQQIIQGHSIQQVLARWDDV